MCIARFRFARARDRWLARRPAFALPSAPPAKTPDRRLRRAKARVSSYRIPFFFSFLFFSPSFSSTLSLSLLPHASLSPFERN